MRIAFSKPTEAKSAMGALLGISGIVLVFWRDLTALHPSGMMQGVALGLGAALLASLGNLVAQRNRNANLPLLPTISVGMMFGGGLALLITLCLGKTLTFDPQPRYLAALAYLAVFGSVLAFAAYLTLMGRVGAAKAGYIAVAVPVVALLFSGWFEGFVWRPQTIAGMVLVVLGNIVMLLDVRSLSDWYARRTAAP
jgi:drug/metabolite transporter (DMT)-like permease